MPIRRYLDVTPQLGKNVFVDDMALAVGDVTIGDDASLWPFVVARGDVQKISIGARTNIQDGSVLHVSQDNRFNPGGYPLVIGASVTVGHNVILHGCTVEDYALIGMGSIILDGAVVQQRAMLAAGSLVSPGKVLDSGYLWLGRPAKKLRPLTDEELAYLEYSANHYVELKNKHLGLSR